MSSSDYISQVSEGDTVMVIESGFIIVAKGTVVRESATRFTVRTENAAADVPALIQFSRKTGKQVGGELHMVEYDSAIYEDALAEMVEVEEQQESEAPAQVATKVEKLAENLKHLDKPGRRDTPHYWWMATSHCVAFVVRGGWWARKAYNGRNKRMGNLGPCDMRVERELGAAVSMVRASRFFEGETVRTPRQSQAIRDGYWHWFPVALENTAYSDAIARHFTWMGQEGLRVTPGFVFGHRLSSKYDGRRYFDKEWAPNELWGNKAQVNRYFACKTY